jgi:hypothetical protein
MLSEYCKYKIPNNPANIRRAKIVLKNALYKKRGCLFINKTLPSQYFSTFFRKALLSNFVSKFEKISIK